MAPKVFREWQKPTPDFARRVLRRFGLNPYGEPRYRIVWAAKDYGRERWALEKWCPPDHYLGRRLEGEPFPARGRYELAYFIGGEDFVPLTEDTAKYYAELIEAGLNYSYAQRKQAIEEREKHKDQAWRKEFSDLWDDAQPVGGVEAAVQGSPARPRPDDVQFRLTAEDLPQNLPRQGFKQVSAKELCR